MAPALRDTTRTSVATVYPEDAIEHEPPPVERGPLVGLVTRPDVLDALTAE